MLSEREASRLRDESRTIEQRLRYAARNGLNGRERYEIERGIAASSSASSAKPATAIATAKLCATTTASTTATVTAATTATRTIAAGTTTAAGP